MQGPCSRILGSGRAAALLLLAIAAQAGAKADSEQLGGDYFVGASVFLFQRTVLIPFAPAGVNDSMLDAGVIVEAHDNAEDEDGAVALDLYYNIQQNFKEKSSSNACFYILMYPDSGLFEKSFGTTSEDIVIAQEGRDYIVGLKNSAQFEKHQDIIRAIREKMSEAANN